MAVLEVDIWKLSWANNKWIMTTASLGNTGPDSGPCYLPLHCSDSEGFFFIEGCQVHVMEECMAITSCSKLHWELKQSTATTGIRAGTIAPCSLSGTEWNSGTADDLPCLTK